MDIEYEAGIIMRPSLSNEAVICHLQSINSLEIMFCALLAEGIAKQVRVGRTGGNPPMLCISVGPRVDHTPDTKDTLSNIGETGEFVINIVSLPLSNTMHESSKNHPRPTSSRRRALPLLPARWSKLRGWRRRE